MYTGGAGWPVITENQYHNLPGPRIQHWGEGLSSIINADPPQTRFDYAYHQDAQFEVNSTHYFSISFEAPNPTQGTFQPKQENAKVKKKVLDFYN